MQFSFVVKNKSCSAFYADVKKGKGDRADDKRIDFFSAFLI